MAKPKATATKPSTKAGMTAKTEASGKADSEEREVASQLLKGAPRQPRTDDAWKGFTHELSVALAGLEEDERLIILIKNTNRFVQFAHQGTAGMRVEAVSGFYLPDQQALEEQDHALVLKLGWGAPTNLPDEFGHRPDGSPNYFLDLAQPVPLAVVAMLAVNTLRSVFKAEHPGLLEYTTGSETNQSIRFPNLGIRRQRD